MTANPLEGQLERLEASRGGDMWSLEHAFYYAGLTSPARRALFGAAVALGIVGTLRPAWCTYDDGGLVWNPFDEQVRRDGKVPVLAVMLAGAAALGVFM